MPGPVDAPHPAPFPAPLDVLLTRLDPDLPVPAHAQPGDAGVDLCCTADVRIDPGERAVVGTGMAVALPVGFAGFVNPRSGLAARTGLSIVNAPGTIDAGYRGEIKVCLVNLDPRDPVLLRRGDRIAQLVVLRVEQLRFTEVPELPGSARGAGAYGSTGGHARLAAPLPGDPLAGGAVTVDPVPDDLAAVESVPRSARTGPADRG